ncbi:carboxylesterase 1C-like [Anticarsia gemmatalis]|uniref:carboxylesterase 1C-like n=1 Tax=Anticarsia gemmatalis TaxID=129554 RepID=UPI003F77246C
MWKFISVLSILNVYVYGRTDVNTSVGIIYGVREEFTKFLGIPYGLIDIYDYFADAKPYPRFETAFHANKHPEKCAQFTPNGPEGTMQCLNLNIYQPNNLTSTDKLPVMVYLHGGNFAEGSGNINEITNLSPISGLSYVQTPKNLIDHNVILVTVNYRLGIFGFLCDLENNYANQGIKDQLLALKWIKNNIAAFGGDENNILLFGHDSGSISADIHLLYSDTDLFNKVIMQSGNFFSPIGKSKPVQGDLTFQSVQRMKDMIKYIINSPEQNVFTTNDMWKNLIVEHKNKHFKPCIDGKFIKNKPRNTNFTNKSILIGNTVNEQMLLRKGTDDLMDRNDTYKMAFSVLPPPALDSIEEFYVMGNSTAETILISNDLLYNYPAEKSAEFYVENKATVYRYLFSYPGGRYIVKYSRSSVLGLRSDETNYLFNLKTAPELTSPEDANMIVYLTTTWTNFAKYGNPSTITGRGAWPKYDMQTKYTRDIGSSLRNVKFLYSARTQFWGEFYEKYRDHSEGFHFY